MNNERLPNWYRLYKSSQQDISVIKNITELGDDKVDTTKYEAPSGHIKMFDKSPYAQGRDSITETIVKEEYRRQGEGTRLLQKALEGRDQVSAQTSSEGSTTFFYNNGFRPVENPNATLEEAVEMFWKNESLGMEWNRA